MTFIFDKFTVSTLPSSRTDTHILTHAHTDHANIPKSFPCIVHCSQLTYQLLKHRFRQLRPSLVLGDVRIGKENIYVFRNYHSPDSVGVYVYSIGLLYWGEGRLHTAREVLQAISPSKVIRIVHDRSTGEYPSITDSANTLSKYIHAHAVDTVFLRNYAQFMLLQQIKGDFRFQLDDKEATTVAEESFVKCFHLLTWNTKSTHTVIVKKGQNGTCTNEKRHVVISGHTPSNCSIVVAYSSHASDDEINDLYSILSKYVITIPI